METKGSYCQERLSEHLWRICDSTGVCCYFVKGTKRACLLDTTNGLGNIKEYVEQMTELPVFVILTHAHLDHMGGSGLFDEVYLSSLDRPVYEFKTKTENRLADARNRLHLPLTESELPPIYTGMFQELVDGQEFSLGGITIEMISVPGHTPGMMCALLKEERTIIFGDACGVAVMLMDQFSSNVSAYRKSLLRLKTYEDRYDIIYRNHGTFTSSKNLLDHVIECCDLILAGKDAHIPIQLYGHELFVAQELVAGGHDRLDGKEGNLLYLQEKAF